ncbi:unnamed protein product [Pleuronectes platessa]|uniref:Uncharacterized protein n=1 Tax=Pleuronectes platessa TaxID=8262 RepID=A0A9N7VPE7_PLEPL|nr:unnamed protein product [Pleuronectes platessa]
MGQDKQTVPVGRRAAGVSYGSCGDCGPGPVSSSTRGMRQLKEERPADSWKHREEPCDLRARGQTTELLEKYRIAAPVTPISPLSHVD